LRKSDSSGLSSLFGCAAQAKQGKEVRLGFGLVFVAQEINFAFMGRPREREAWREPSARQNYDVCSKRC
jgi:hypothetical protein